MTKSANRTEMHSVTYEQEKQSGVSAAHQTAHIIAYGLAGLSINYAVGFIQDVHSAQKNEDSSDAQTVIRNGSARKFSKGPIERIVSTLEEHAPRVTASHITRAGEVLTELSLIAAAKNPKAFLPKLGVIVGSMCDALDGAKARRENPDPTLTEKIDGMLQDVRADKRQEIIGSLVLAYMHRKAGNSTGSFYQAISAATVTLPAYYRAHSEANGAIVPEGGLGTRVGRAVLNIVELFMMQHSHASSLIAATSATGNIITALQRKTAASNSKISDYAIGSTTTDEQLLASKRLRALRPYAITGAVIGLQAATKIVKPEN
jgi:hypothetical protein